MEKSLSELLECARLNLLLLMEVRGFRPRERDNAKHWPRYLLGQKPDTAACCAIFSARAPPNRAAVTEAAQRAAEICLLRIDKRRASLPLLTVLIIDPAGVGPPHYLVRRQLAEADHGVVRMELWHLRGGLQHCPFQHAGVPRQTIATPEDAAELRAAYGAGAEAAAPAMLASDPAALWLGAGPGTLIKVLRLDGSTAWRRVTQDAR